MYHESPGSIRFQLGSTVSAIRDAVRAGDMPAVADLTDFAVTICAPKLEEKEEAELRRAIAEGASAWAAGRRDRDGSATRTFHAACQGVLSRLLRRMSQQGLYAYLPAEIQEGGEAMAEGAAEQHGETLA